MKTWSIKTKSLVLFVAYLLALSAVYATFTVQLVRRESSAVLERLEQTSRILAAEIDSYLEPGKQRLATIAKLPGLVHGLTTIKESSAAVPFPPSTTLHYLFFRSSVFTGGVFLVDYEGTVLWTEPPGHTLIGRSLATYTPIVNTLRTKKGLVSPALEADALFGGPHVVLTALIAGPEGEHVGVLAGVVDLASAELTKILATIAATDRFARVVDQRGTVLASTDATQVLRPLDATIGADVTTTTTTLAQAPWRVITGEPRAAERAEIWRLQRGLLALGAAVILLAAAIGWPFVRGFVNSVNALTGHAEAMALGDLSRPVAIDDRHDELAILARTFDRMRQELARTQRALEQRLEEREELIRLKEEFMANVSHELRTPLNVIIGFSDLLHDDEPSAERRDVLARLRTQAEHLYQLVRDVMTLSGLNTGKLELTVRPVDVAEVRTKLMPMVEHLCLGKPVAFRWESAAGVPTLETDTLRLEQILGNLITNAFKFTAQGEITVRVRCDGGSRVVFEVADTGIGIAPEDLPHIFDEFRQVDGSMSREQGGMGLGLALVRRLATLLGGEITAASTFGVGSTFVLTLPVHPPDVWTAREAAHDRSAA